MGLIAKGCHVLNEGISPVYGNDTRFETMVQIGIGMDGRWFFAKSWCYEIFIKISRVATNFEPFVWSPFVAK